MSQHTTAGRLAALALLGFTACNPDKPADKPTPSTSDGFSLRRFEDCDGLRDYVASSVLETVLNYRYNTWMYLDYAAEDGAESDSSGGGGPSDYTTTNVQEEGVDEPDMVKTDGEYIYVAQDSAFYIVDSWPADTTSLASKLDIDGYTYSMFLEGDSVVLFSYVYDDLGFAGEYSWGGTRIDLLDVSDRADPRIVRSIDVDGYLADARMIDGVVYAVLNTTMDIPSAAWDLVWNETLGLPPASYDDSDAERAAKVAVARMVLKPTVDAIVADLPTEQLLPMWRDQGAGEPEAAAQPMLACSDVYQPPEVSYLSMLDVLRLDLNAPLDAAPLSATGVLSNGWVVYASTQNLYIGQSSWWWWFGWGDFDLKTQIHKFSLGQEASYEGSGEVDGWLLDQFSMSEYDGYLRVATSDVDWWWGTGGDSDAGSRITVLQDNGEGLAKVGELSGLAPGEWIYASRMMGDKGYLVTYQQVDPLFTLDLSDPTAPAVMGELKLPGYSAYLHPMDADHLLAVGMDGTDEGSITGLAVNLFDVSDLNNPQLAWQWTTTADEGESWGWSEALYDHHAFTFHNGLLSIPIYTYTYDGSHTHWWSGLVVLSVDAEAGIEEVGRVDHSSLLADSDCPAGYGSDCYYSYAWMRRGLYIEDWLYSVSNYGVLVNELADPSVEVGRVVFNPKD